MNYPARSLLMVLVFAVTIMIASGKESQNAKSIDEIRQFLRVWLVQGDHERAASFLTSQPKVCTPSPESGETKLLPNSESKAILIKGMQIAKERLGHRSVLSEAIQPIPVGYFESFERLNTGKPVPFTVIKVPAEKLQDVACGSVKNLHLKAQPAILAAFLFRVAPEETEGMSFVFQREGRYWKIVSFDRLKQ